MIMLDQIYKAYRMGQLPLPVLKGISLHVEAGEFVAIMGASGSGKSTLLNIIGCLDLPDAGNYRLCGQPVDHLGEQELARLRNQRLGFIFQLFNLIPRIDAQRNVELPLIYARLPRQERRQRALEALDKVGLADRARHSPAQLSGGQQQRVAIARALVTHPDILIADEPTGSLDSTVSHEILAIFHRLHREGRTIVMVTHEEEVARFADRIVRLKDGRVVTDNRAPGGVSEPVSERRPATGTARRAL